MGKEISFKRRILQQMLKDTTKKYQAQGYSIEDSIKKATQDLVAQGVIDEKAAEGIDRISNGDPKDAITYATMGAFAGYKAGSHSKGDDEGVYAEKNKKQLRSPWISQGKQEPALKYATMGAVAGYKAGSGLGDNHGLYSEDALRKEEDRLAKAQKEAETRVPGWIETGAEYIYPERLEDWKKSVENSAKGGLAGFDIAKALEVMQMLDSDAKLEDVIEKYKSPSQISGPVAKLILTFSKRGPEYMEQFMSTMGQELPPKFKEKLETIKAENRQFALNELERNRATKEAKTGELARTSSELEELSADSQGKETNQNVQE